MERSLLHIVKTTLVMFLLVGHTYAQNNAIFSGGNGDGFDQASIRQALNNAIFSGGNGDGFDVASFRQALNNSIFAGGEGDGFGIVSIRQSVNNSIFAGGEGDGFDRVTLVGIVPYVWTGAVGTGWLVAGNWSENVVPDINRPVIIPDGVPNWPFINSGLFAIGDNPNNGSFQCASLWIQENALLVTRVNNKIENYALVTIDGEMSVRNPTADAFQNFADGSVIINDGGILKIKP